MVTLWFFYYFNNEPVLSRVVLNIYNDQSETNKQMHENIYFISESAIHHIKQIGDAKYFFVVVVSLKQ